MVTVGNVIQDSDFNDAAGRVAAILGFGSGQTGYGQRVASAELQVDTNDIITAAHYNTLITNINKCSQHQANNNILGFTYDGQSAPTGANIVGADASGITLTRVANGFTIDDPNNSEGFNDVLTAITTIENNANNFAGESFTVGDPTDKSLVNSDRGSQWNNFIYCEMDVQFTAQYTSTNSNGTTTTISGTTNDHRRHFFNAGGELYISISFTSPQESKDVQWKAMFDNMDYIAFGKSATTRAGGGSAANGVDISPPLGNFQMTTSYQTIYTKTGDPSSVYAANNITIEAKRVGNNTLRFKITLNDASGGVFDEDVQRLGGTITAGIEAKVPSGDTPVPSPVGYEQTSFQNT